MRTSERGIRFIARFEGFRSRPYKIGADPWTIGYGETQGVGPNTPPVTRAAARRLLKRRVDRDFAPHVTRALERYGRKVSQRQFDALVSAVYNLGPGVLEPDRSLGAALKRGRGVRTALLLYVMPGSIFEAGLRRRRRAEARMWARGRKPFRRRKERR